MERDSFIFNKNYYRAIENLPEDIRKETHAAITEYASNGDDHSENLNPVARCVFMLLKNQIDAENDRIEKFRDYGRQGGRPRKSVKSAGEKSKNLKNGKRGVLLTFEKNLENTDIMTVEIDEKGGITDKSIENQKEKPLILSKRKTKEKPPKGGKKKGELSFSPSPQKESRMIPPTVEQVAEYCKNRGNSVNAEKFVDFYQSKGWIVGKVKMKDWQASVRTWEKSENYNRPVKTVQKQIIPFPELAKHIIQKEMDWVRKWKSANLRDVEGAMDKVGKYMNDFVNEQKKKGVEGMTIEEFKDKFPLWNRGILEER